jgi:hypothetical protein
MPLSQAQPGLTPQIWDDKFFTSYVRKNQFAQYMGTSENSLIQIKESLTTKAGESVTFALVNDLAGNGVTGRSLLEGQEDVLGERSYKLPVTLIRNGVAVHDWDAQLSTVALREAAKPALRTWAAKKLRNDIINGMNSINGLAYGTASAAQRDAWLVDNADRVLFGAAKANTKATYALSLTELDATADKFTKENLSLARRMLKQASPTIRPIYLEDGTEWYVAFAPSNAFRDFKASMATVLQNAEVRGKDNPLFSDHDLIWDGVIVREIPEMTVLPNVGAGGTVDAAAVKIMGAQAMAISWAQRTTSRTEVRDYGAVHGVAIQEIRGVGLMQFGTQAVQIDVNYDLGDLKDHGTFTLWVAAEPDA